MNICAFVDVLIKYKIVNLMALHKYFSLCLIASNEQCEKWACLSFSESVRKFAAIIPFNRPRCLTLRSCVLVFDVVVHGSRESASNK